MKAIDNPNFAKVIDYFETNDYCIIVQEYCDVNSANNTNTIQFIES